MTVVGKAGKAREIYLDVLRIIACYLVIFNHTGNRGFGLYISYAGVSVWKFAICSFVSVICKAAVPIFFAISGSLLLGKREPIRKIFEHRISRIVYVLIVFNFIYYIRELHYSRSLLDFNLKEFLITMYSSQWTGPLWYLYAYLSFLLALPVLRALVQNLESKDFWYIVGLVFLFTGVIPMVEFLVFNNEVRINNNLGISWFSGWFIFYPCLGYYLCAIDEKWIEKHWRQLIAVNIIGISVTSLHLWIRILRLGGGNANTDVLELPLKSFIVVVCVTLFLLIKYFCGKLTISETAAFYIGKIGERTFGIYLFHILVKNSHTFSRLWNLFLDVLKWNALISSLVFCAIVMVVSYVVTTIVQKLPFVKRIL